jgi:hypothetical protein
VRCGWVARNDGGEAVSRSGVAADWHPRQRHLVVGQWGRRVGRHVAAQALGTGELAPGDVDRRRAMRNRSVA